MAKNEIPIEVNDFPDGGNIKVKLVFKYGFKFKIKIWLVTKLLIIAARLMNSSIEFEHEEL